MPLDLCSFSDQLYARADVASACLELQGEGADVCLLLTALWLDRRGVAHSPERERQLRQLATPWQQEVVKALRQLRQDWREKARQDTALDELRERLKQLELHAEWLQLQRLQELAGDWAKTPEKQRRVWLQALTVVLLTPRPAACDRLHRASLELLLQCGA